MYSFIYAFLTDPCVPERSDLWVRVSQKWETPPKFNAEFQKPRRRVGNADRKVFARIYKVVHKMKPKHQLKSE